MKMRFLCNVLFLSLALFGVAGSAYADEKCPQRAEANLGRTVRFKGFNNFSSTLLMKLNLGYEYATVDNTFQKGFPRIGLTLYATHFQAPLNPNDGVLTFGIHNSFTAQLTSSAEQLDAKNVTAGGDGGITSANMGSKRALELDTMLFLPILRTQYGVQLIGPIGVFGAKKVDDRSKFDGRYYSGIRFARNPEMYGDILLGKTEGLTSTRLEARGQFPVYKDWLFLGAIGNFGIKDKDKDRSQLTEADSIRVFLTWNVEAEVIFGRIFALVK